MPFSEGCMWFLKAGLGTYLGLLVLFIVVKVATTWMKEFRRNRRQRKELRKGQQNGNRTHNRRS